jgi:hypothetical protein
MLTLSSHRAHTPPSLFSHAQAEFVLAACLASSPWQRWADSDEGALKRWMFQQGEVTESGWSPYRDTELSVLEALTKGHTERPSLRQRASKRGRAAGGLANDPQSATPIGSACLGGGFANGPTGSAAPA